MLPFLPWMNSTRAHTRKIKQTIFTFIPMWIGKSDAKAGCGWSAGSSGSGRGQDIIAAPTCKKEKETFRKYCN